MLAADLSGAVEAEFFGKGGHGIFEDGRVIAGRFDSHLLHIFIGVVCEHSSFHNVIAFPQRQEAMIDEGGLPDFV